MGFPLIEQYPSIVSSDVGGVVASIGSEVQSTSLKPGVRVVALASSFYYKGSPNYGALQRYVLVRAECVTVLPDALSFVEGSVFPLAVFTAWNGWNFTGVPLAPLSAPAGAKKEVVLVWGASTSVGTIAVQAAKVMGYTVYATASAQHHDYIKSLGATRMFDYKAEDVGSQIKNAAKEDGVDITKGYLAQGDQQLVVDLMNELKGQEARAKLAIAPLVDTELKPPETVETTFVRPPEDLAERNQWSSWIFNVWLQENLAGGSLVPSPKIKVVEGGLESANKALDELRAGVSCLKIVVQL
ncbi:hypothetical protein N7510_003149 [Penicillium lagena]|uniref:uncharacterized protein n=1 Tax=Penicillium lagena TaxID=94218 RepID=UPI00253F7E58|nr:uncharacterized protein N7510_003149 [Penicillium lagena]KAJ5619165.1 hypothetical protein N7510_003149 [Penicillium lagena]